MTWDNDWKLPLGGTKSAPVSSVSDSKPRRQKRLASRQLQKKIRLALLHALDDGTNGDFIALARYIVDNHGGQLPYERQFWGSFWRKKSIQGCNVDTLDIFNLSQSDEKLAEVLAPGITHLRHYTAQLIMSMRVISDHSAISYPPDLSDDHIHRWFQRQNVTDLRALAPESLPRRLSFANISQALMQLGILISESKGMESDQPEFDLLATGKSDTRSTAVTIGQRTYTVKRCRTNLAVPTLSELPLPKIGVFLLTDSITLLLFYLNKSFVPSPHKKPKCNAAIGSTDSSATTTDDSFEENGLIIRDDVDRLFASSCRQPEQSNEYQDIYHPEANYLTVDEYSREPEEVTSNLCPWEAVYTPKRVREIPVMWRTESSKLKNPSAFLLELPNHNSGTQDVFIFLATSTQVVDEGVLWKIHKMAEMETNKQQPTISTTNNQPEVDVNFLARSQPPSPPIQTFPAHMLTGPELFRRSIQEEQADQPNNAYFQMPPNHPPNDLLANEVYRAIDPKERYPDINLLRNLDLLQNQYSHQPIEPSNIQHDEFIEGNLHFPSFENNDAGNYQQPMDSVTQYGMYDQPMYNNDVYNEGSLYYGESYSLLTQIERQ